jgi:hypothetical protein
MDGWMEDGFIFRDKRICKLKPHNGIRCKPSDDPFQRIREKLYLVRGVCRNCESISLVN